MDAITLSPLGLFLAAGPVGRGVMILLGLASLWCWVLIVEGLFAAARLRRAVSAPADAAVGALLAPVFEAGHRAGAVMVPGESVGERRQRLAEAMGRAARLLLAEAEGRLPDLAVIASVSPFIGLFGTVWGIMASFAGIATAQDTSLAVVAPGIAEALAATAYGLATAIPASVAYSRLGASFARMASALADRIDEHAVTLVAGKAVR
ncbi:MotA/TolQ/ExbB proton channel family protein [Prosthecodimorpha staleyi]|uniref:MotA/TolQ/ExbB proton channel family protein n=1 Tax=Prosthecodimorpha staleyi TaxID=2840188 RepID=A0A947GCG6_9HYPH|nr:MotA/TolQ/ExbB proton channel family protein [Prosthecodimorpha staleyi]MBT9289727.1 MotA/TolQ/ExbB proton channel family protein [Prosthecodimorpha staleyi]